MAKQDSLELMNSLYKTPMQRFIVRCKKNWQLHLMVLIPFAYYCLFEFGPMYGLQIAFRDYRTRKGIWGSDWVGLDEFYEFFRNVYWTRYVRNTLTISLYSIAAGFPIPIILALIIHINERKKLKWFAQNLSYLPHFISTVIMVGILNQVFSPFFGIYAVICNALGVENIVDIRAEANAFYHLYVWSGVWQGMGWSAIMYVAALAAVPMELHEAAKIDGASRWKRVIHVDLPTIMPTVCIMLILRFGSIMGVGHEKAYLMQRDTNIEKSELISTYIYKYGLANSAFSFGTAVGLLNSVLNTCMILFVNWITDKLSEGENSLF